jgi:hypothetical protein
MRPLRLPSHPSYNTPPCEALMPFTYRRFPVHCAVSIPNEQRIVVPEAGVRWSRGQEFAVETVMVDQHTQARLWHYVKRLVLTRESILVNNQPCGHETRTD